MEKLSIIKIGGNIIDDKAKLDQFIGSFVQISGKKLLIHGGGKVATRIGEKLGIEAVYSNGRRITDQQTIDLVTMVYGGLVNKQIVSLLQSFKCNAIGLTGADGNCIPATKRPVTTTDFGFAGDIDTRKLNSSTILLLLDHGLVPVLAPLTHDGKGQMLNTNADTIAAAIAVAYADKYDVELYYCFEKDGVLLDADDPASLIRELNKDSYRQLLQSGAVKEGILPKLDNAFSAASAGVKKVVICNADQILENTNGQQAGTLIGY